MLLARGRKKTSIAFSFASALLALVFISDSDSDYRTSLHFTSLVPIFSLNFYIQ